MPAEATQPRYADVVLPVPVDHPFTYSVPPALAARVQPGMRALVPVRDRIETGYVVGLPATTAVENLRAIIDLPDDGPLFTGEMLRLCRWLADYYCASWGEALQCAVPPGVRIGSALRYALAAGALEGGRYSERQRHLLAALHRAGAQTEKQLAAALALEGPEKTKLRGTLTALVRRGALTATPVMQRGRVGVRTETFARLNEAVTTDAAGIEALQRRAPKQAALYLDLLYGEAEQAAADLIERHNATLAMLRALADKGLIALVTRETYRRPETNGHYGGGEKHALNDEQQAALEAVRGALAARRFQTFLLHGITGSGKTEVYLQAIEAALAQGRQAILLVPEISLTPQTVGRLFARFKADIAVLHSGLSGGERYDEWRRAQRGEVNIVVGARSAVFAPLPRLGLVLVDEEHDGSYKQGETPRYHARDVAIMRAQLNDAVCVLGSATPSLESFHNSVREKSVRLSLRTRATAGALPEVKLIDMRRETREQGGEIILSQQLEEAVHARLEAKEQVILLLNRRGFAPVVMCPSCAWVAACEHCQVSLTFHTQGGVLRCHYCNAEYPQRGACPECKTTPLLFLGSGTQKAEDYLARTFRGARIARMDADSTQRKGGHARILSAFAAGETDLLIGTQMLAKGHDYPGVTLVGVVNADRGLTLPDFRAAESGFQLLCQVAGRAGRGAQRGEVLIQTYRPRHYAIQAAAQHDYHAFYTAEIAQREAAGFPPFRRLAHFVLEAPDPQEAERNAVLLRRIAREQREALGLQGIEIMGPAPAIIRQIQGRYRWTLGLLSKSPKRLNALVRGIRPAFDEARTSSRVALKVDFDPVNAL